MNREDIRIRVAGIYIENNKILLVQHHKNNQDYYLLPGGGQHVGEDLKAALVREWKEELNLVISPGELLFMGESIPPDVDKRRHVHQIVFSVESIEGAMSLQADETLVGCAWIDLANLPGLTLYPRCMDQILAYIYGKNPLSRYIRYEWI